MRALVIIGIVLAGLGAYIVLTGGVSYGGAQRSVMTVGDLVISTEERHTMPAWVGGIALVGGLLLLGAGVWEARSADT